MHYKEVLLKINCRWLEVLSGINLDWSYHSEFPINNFIIKNNSIILKTDSASSRLKTAIF